MKNKDDDDLPVVERWRQGTGHRRPAVGLRAGGLNKKLAYAKELRAIGIHKPVKTLSKSDLDTMKKLKEMLRTQWHTLVDQANEFKRVSARQLEFLRRYAINGRQQKLRCMLAAGYKSKDHSDLYKMADATLAAPFAETLLQAFELEEKAKMGLMVEDVVMYFQKIADTALEREDYTNANRAMENLAKYLGMFV